MEKIREIRDPIHGFIKRDLLEEQVIDTKAFQRLRGIKQLALASLVYPGAVHTRFEHSIGVMHIAERLSTQIGIAERVIINKLRLAALLHDIGHGPFSHVSEEPLDRFSEIKSKNLEKTHEQITCKIIERDSELSRLISENDREEIINLIKGKNCDTFLRGIISGPLDADKQDYLLRDSYYCGVKYGIFDIDRLISSICKIDDPYAPSIGITKEGVYALEQFVTAKYHMTTQVYRHKTRLVTDSMTIRAINLAIEIDKIKEIIELYKYDATDKFINNFLKWNDNQLTYFILNYKKKSIAKELFSKLFDRKLFKRVLEIEAKEIQPKQRFLLFNDKSVPGEKRDRLFKNIEQEIALFLSRKFKERINKHFVIFKPHSLKSIIEQAKDDESSIMVKRIDSKPNDFLSESEIFSLINEAQSQNFVEVYAPVHFRDEKHKERSLKEIKEKIIDIIQEIIKSE